jgi:hypothetical protein
MKYAIEIVSGAMICIQSFIKIGSGIQKLIGGIHRHTDSMVISQAYFHFFQNKESRLKRNGYVFLSKEKDICDAMDIRAC